MADTFFDRINNAKSLSTAFARFDSLASSGEEDWFKIKLEAGTRYTVRLDGSEVSPGLSLSDPELIGLYDDAGTAVDGSETANAGAGVIYSFVAPSSADYYFGVSASGRTGSYNVALEAGERILSAANVTQIDVGQTLSDRIENGTDVDVFAVTFEAGETYTIDMLGADQTKGTLANPFIEGILNDSQVLIANTSDDDSGSGEDARVVYTASYTGVHYIQAASNGLSTGTYQLRVAGEGSEGIDPADITSVNLDTVKNGTISSADEVDYFKVTLSANNRYAFEMKGDSTSSGTLDDPRIIAVYGPDGSKIDGAANNNGGTENYARLYFNAEASGDYIIGVIGNSGTTGSYKFSTAFVRSLSGEPTDGGGDTGGGDTGGGNTGGGDTGGGTTGGGVLPADDIGSTTLDHGILNLGATSTSTIDISGDEDWYKVSLSSNVRYQIDVRGLDSNSGTLADPVILKLRNADGDVIVAASSDIKVSNNNGGEGQDARLFYTATSSDLHYVAVSGFDGSTGTYDVSIVTAGSGAGSGGGGPTTDDIGTTLATARAIVLGAPTQTSIDSVGDVDWFEVTLIVGERYQVDLMGVDGGGGTLLDPALVSMYNAQGTLIADTTNNNGGTGSDARKYFTAPETGKYYIAAEAKSDGIGTYSVLVESLTSGSGGGVSADIGNTIATSQRLLEGESQFSRIDTATDEDWFAVSLVAGERYRFDMRGADSSAGTLSDPFVMSLADSSGAAIAASTGNNTSNNNGGTGQDARLYYTASYTGTHYLSAASHGDSVGSYQVMFRDTSDITASDEDDYDNSTQTTGAISAGQSVTGVIETAGDSDWFFIAMDRGKHYQIELDGAPSASGSLADPYFFGVWNSQSETYAQSWNNDGQHCCCCRHHISRQSGISDHF
ncbi:MAG: hypothetical protein ACPG7W_02780, partial [Paracoccaceae bacterium]